MIRFKFILKNLAAFITVKLVNCSIDGVSYATSINMRPIPNLHPRDGDPCNPLYWYPRNIPEYCQYRNFQLPNKPVPASLPMPLPVPIPQPQYIVPMPAVPPLLPPFAPVPYGQPSIPSNLMSPPVSSPVMLTAPNPILSYTPNAYSNHPQQTGMVPGIPGVVSNDGGINILPFSDAYSDLIENHKNQMIRRRLKKLIAEYEEFPNRRNYRRIRKYARRHI